MKKLIAFKAAVRLCLTLFVLFTIFHILVISNIVPRDILWGGRISDPFLLGLMEVVSLLVLLCCTGLLLSKSRWMFRSFSHRADTLFWILPVLFALNSAGNLMAVHVTERLLFTPLTLLLTFLTFRIALEKFEKTDASV